VTLTPATLRLDLKCGKGAISEGEKCTKGAATKRAPRAGAKERFLKKAGTLGAIGSLGYTAVSIARGKSGQALGGLSAFMASSSAYSAGEAMGYERKGQKAKARLARAQAGIAAGYGLGAAALLGYEASATRRYTQNVASGSDREWQNRYTQERRGTYGGTGGAGGARPPRRGYQADPFRELGVSSSASAADLKKAWKAKMMQHHPDRGGDPETAKKINEAYQAILRAKGIKDSIYADGFDIDWEAIAL
jgi:DnaJ-domain-containing protein 1